MSGPTILCTCARPWPVSLADRLAFDIVSNTKFFVVNASHIREWQTNIERAPKRMLAQKQALYEYVFFCWFVFTSYGLLAAHHGKSATCDFSPAHTCRVRWMGRFVGGFGEEDAAFFLSVVHVVDENCENMSMCALYWGGLTSIQIRIDLTDKYNACA